MNIFLMLDYDGTLTSIKNYPALARLSPVRRMILRTLSRQKSIRMAIISGRKLVEIKRMVGLPGIIYAGNHGLDIVLPGRHFIHPEARRFAPVLAGIIKDLSPLRRIKGVLIEDKEYTLSVHFRRVPAAHLKVFYRLFHQLMGRWLSRVRMTEGKKVIEIRPPTDWDKGKAVKWVIGQLGLGDHWPVYIGDDKTDEDAFRVLRKKGTTIHVGGGKTPARMRIKTINGVYRYLESLIKNES